MTRRQWMQSLGTPVLLTRAQAQVTPGMVRFGPEMEPLVASIESTAREKCVEWAASQLRGGVSYRQMLAAIYLAGVRNVNPRPPGFALHCLFVIHAAHLLSLEAPPDMRLLPLFYALDQFKASQERDARQTTGDYRMPPLGGTLPPPARAAAELTAAMDAWDMERAERAVAVLARAQPAAQTFELLWQYGARDQRNIGHKAIFTANAWRTLQTIGWQHSEPVLRSLVLGLLDFGRDRKVNGYAFEDQTYLENRKRLGSIPASWAAGEAVSAVTLEIAAAIRKSTPAEACALTAALLTRGKANAQTLWDAVHLSAAELAMRAQGGNTISGIHAVTAANGMRHSYLSAADPRTQLLVALQAVGWMGQFRVIVEGRSDAVRDVSIVDFEAGPSSGAPDAAAGKLRQLAVTERGGYLAGAVRTTIAKGDEVHYYKYLAALIEDVPLVSAAWQPHLLAATVYYAKTGADRESDLMRRAREAVG